MLSESIKTFEDNNNNNNDLYTIRFKRNGKTLFYNFFCEYELNSDGVVITELVLFDENYEKVFPSLNSKELAKKIYNDDYKLWFSLLEAVDLELEV